MMRIEIPHEGIRAARRELRATQAEIDKRIPSAISRTIRRLRTLVAGSRGFLKQQGITANLRRRVIASARRGRGNLWLGANDVPAEKIRGNIRARVGARNLRTARDGKIPDSFVIRAGGKKLYMRRFPNGRYGRILSAIEPDVEQALQDAVDNAPAEFRKALLAGIQRGRRAAQYRGR